MPRLNCSVSNCSHNADDACCLNQIGVSANNAVNSDDTCCSNFMEGMGATNDLSTPNASLEVGCAASNCTHNDGSRCCADSIDISGQGASNAVDTCCSSFCEQ